MSEAQTIDDHLDIDLLDDSIRKFSRQVCLQIAIGNWDAAKRVVDMAARERAEEKQLPAFLDTNLAELEMPVRTLNMLEAEFDAYTIRDLLRLKTATLLNTHEVSVATIDGIWRAVLQRAVRIDDLRLSLASSNS